jgi:hypothetical protein
MRLMAWEDVTRSCDAIEAMSDRILSALAVAQVCGLHGRKGRVAETCAQELVHVVQFRISEQGVEFCGERSSFVYGDSCS